MKRVRITLLSCLFILTIACGMVWGQATAQISGTARERHVEGYSDGANRATNTQ